jgi:cytochrome c-type biogenesis protein CcmE
MHPRRKKRLIVVAAIVCGVALAAGLTLTALNQNINLFYSPSQIVGGEVPDNATIRIGGMVVTNSVSRNESSLDVTFDLTDTAETISVSFSGILPDLFREGQGIVAMGKLEGDKFIASEVLAKHDETYMSPEVSEALKVANKKLHGNNTPSYSTEPLTETNQ